MENHKIKLKILSWNVNGLRASAKKNALLWVDEINPDILCLQEIKATENEIPKCFNKTYEKSTINSGIRKGFSGTLTYSNKSYHEESFCKVVDCNDEGRIIEQHYKNLVIFNVYFPNGKVSENRLKYKLQFFKDFNKHCETLREKGKSIIICGDFNTAHKDIDLKKTKIYNKSGFSDTEREGIERFIKQGYLDSYRYIHGNKEGSYTWWSYRSKGRIKNEGWRIDYIFVSSDLKDKIKSAFILDEIQGSDHCPIGIEIEI